MRNAQLSGAAYKKHAFDWSIFDAQPREIKELSWYEPSGRLSASRVYSADELSRALPVARERVSETTRRMAMKDYGPDHPQAMD